MCACIGVCPLACVYPCVCMCMCVWNVFWSVSFGASAKLVRLWGARWAFNQAWLTQPEPGLLDPVPGSWVLWRGLTSSRMFIVPKFHFKSLQTEVLYINCFGFIHKLFFLMSGFRVYLLWMTPTYTSCGPWELSHDKEAWCLYTESFVLKWKRVYFSSTLSLVS